ncbi:hypothetical protein AB0M50_06730 [Nonomuraea fuscirosea]|jgi:hypothetical protein|uniref:hypothetical protein n=1 Tax=Nonomuraea fuscirosea TaxID=1291556 RepID=UPI002DD83F4A|nr:hypothetical protein [Nonomuraea fuscirosea]WSA50364.1 hypothetical protein OIE67_40865 [Nonomuraea fuscirosea]
MSENAPEMKVDPNLFDARENSPSSMRVIAQELKSTYNALNGKSERPNGNVHQIHRGGEVSTAQFGQWNDATRLAAVLGSDNAGRKFVEVYEKFIKAFEEVADAVDASAQNHDAARRTNEGEA